MALHDITVFILVSIRRYYARSQNCKKNRCY